MGHVKLLLQWIAKTLHGIPFHCIEPRWRVKNAVFARATRSTLHPALHGGFECSPAPDMLSGLSFILTDERD
jgi:hypothetical protein